MNEDKHDPENEADATPEALADDGAATEVLAVAEDEDAATEALLVPDAVVPDDAVPVNLADPIDPAFLDEGDRNDPFGAGLQLPTGHVDRVGDKASDDTEGLPDLDFDPRTPIELADGDAPSELADAEPGEIEGKRRNPLLVVAAVVVGLALVAATVGAVLLVANANQNNDAADALASATSTDASTAEAGIIDPSVLDLVPARVGNYTLMSAKEATAMTDGGAAKAWDVTYKDPDTGDTITVTAGKWADAASARAWADAAGTVIPADQLVDSGDIEGGDGHFWQSKPADGQGQILWTQTARVMVFNGADGSVKAFYLAYPF